MLVGPKWGREGPMVELPGGAMTGNLHEKAV